MSSQHASTPVELGLSDGVEHGANIESILGQIATTAALVLRFRFVTINLRRPDGSFEVVADVGRGKLLGTRTQVDFWEDLLREEHRVGVSYLVPPMHTRSVMQAHPAATILLDDAAANDELDTRTPLPVLIVPVQGRERHIVGYISADAPLDGRVPNRDTIAALETFAEHAALVCHNTRLNDALRAQSSAVQTGDERFRSLIQNATDITEVLSPEGMVLYASPSVEQVLGYKPAEKVGTMAVEFVHPDDRSRVLQAWKEILLEDAKRHTVDLRVRHRDGSYRHIETNSTNLLHDPSVEGIVINYRDITKRKAFEERLRHQAFHDQLTALPNRTLFLDRVDFALSRAKRRGTAVAVLFLDLDRFKVVNDSFGHEAGDQLLSEVAGRLRSCLRPEDTIARLGGDEFTILLDDITGLCDAVRVAERVLDRLQTPFTIGRQSVLTSASIGIVLNIDAGGSSEDLLRDADMAMYRAKNLGKARYEVFDTSMNTQVVRRMELENDLCSAVERSDFVVHYHPTIELSTGRTVGMEALVRWQHPGRGLLHPLEFMRVAEDTGLVVPIGRWVIREACRQTKIWHDQHPDHPPALWINLCSTQFQDPGLVGFLMEVLTSTGLPARSLYLEVTENTLMEATRANLDNLRGLSEMGIRVAIDDVGAGYTSVSHLKQVPIDMLKVDRSFVLGLGKNTTDSAIVRAAVTLARDIGIELSAEGIETTQQLEVLREMRCLLGQGYLFTQPLTGEEASRLLG